MTLGWPSCEVAALKAARIAGKTHDRMAEAGTVEADRLGLADALRQTPFGQPG